MRTRTKELMGHMIIPVIFLNLFLFPLGLEGREIQLGPPTIKNVTVQHRYFFTIRSYIPPVQFDKSYKNDEKNFETPEVAVQEWFVAMLRGDYARWLSLWDESSRERVLAKNKKRGRDEKSWKETWAKGFALYTTFELTRRVDTEGYVIIEIRGTGDLETTKEIVKDIPLTKTVDGSWRITNGFGDDPVFGHWRNPEIHGEKIVRTVPQ